MEVVDTSNHGYGLRLGLDTKMACLSEDQARLALAALLPSLERLWACQAQAAACVTLEVASSFGRRAWKNHGLQNLIQQANILASLQKLIPMIFSYHWSGCPSLFCTTIAAV